MVLELITFLGLALFVEGVMLALFPTAIRRMMAEMSGVDGGRLRVIGLAFAGGAAFLLVILAHVWREDQGAVVLGFSGTRQLIGGLM